MDNYTPEERKRVVDDAINVLQSKKSPIVTPPKKDDLDLLIDRLTASARKIYALVQPIYEADRDNGTPLAEAKKRVLGTLHKFWLDELTQYNEDEAKYIAALAQSVQMMESML